MVTARTLSRMAFLGFALLAIGCASWNTKTDTAPKEGATRRDDGNGPTAQQMVAFLNRQSSEIKLLDSKRVIIEANSDGSRIPSLDGYLVCEKGRNFRLTGNSLVGSEFDLGSNGDQFWYWVKRAPEPYVFYCRYEDFNKGVRLPFPFQPEWVLEVLGMGDYPNPDQFAMKPRGNFYELSEQTESQGQPVTKVTIISRNNVAPPMPQVVGKELRDAKGQLIAKATIKSTQFDRKSHVPVPRVVVLEYPAQKVTMTLTLGDVTVNGQLGTEEARKLFTRPQWREFKSVDLAQMLQTNPVSNVRQTGAVSRRSAP